MIELINIPKQCICNRVIPIAKIFSKDQEQLSSAVNAVSWYAVIRPSNFNSEKVVTNSLRYEEIQIIQVDIKNADLLFDVARVIYRRIKYPCILIIGYNGVCTKYVVSACRFSPGKNDYDVNVLQSLVMSHWVHPDCLSDNAKQFIDSLNEALEKNGNLYEIYSALYQAITMFKLSGTSKTHTKSLIDYICGKWENPKVGDKDKILRFCTPYRFNRLRHRSRTNYYSRNNGNQPYSLIYDYEDIWYCFLQNDYIRNYLEKNRYRDIGYLVYCIDDKLYDEDL